MNDILNNIKAYRTAYSEGYAAGVQEILLKVQSELSNVALETKANNNESLYENLVVMLSDVDKVIYKLLEKSYED